MLKWNEYKLLFIVECKILHWGSYTVTLYFDRPLQKFLLTVNNFATICQLAVSRVLVDCLLYILTLSLSAYSANPKPTLTVYSES